jgi:hypothetical protein
VASRDPIGTAASFPLIRTLTRDTRRVFGQVRRGGFRREAARTFEDLEGFYLSEERQRRLAGMGWVRRWLHRIAWLPLIRGRGAALEAHPRPNGTEDA